VQPETTPRSRIHRTRSIPDAIKQAPQGAEVQEHMARKLYVGNLPYDTGEQDLQALFGEAGTVESVNVMRDMATGRARGFAFVEMASDEDAQKAIDKFNDYQLGGRNLTVNEARPKPQGGGGGGFGGGGGSRRREPRW
jgi:RNA recognition motif-containing protein